jgi:hypothetical protein
MRIRKCLILRLFTDATFRLRSSLEKGRRGSKKQLTERFEQAIDRAAMRSGMAGTDDYLTEWRKGESSSLEGDPETLVQQ